MAGVQTPTASLRAERREITTSTCCAIFCFVEDLIGEEHAKLGYLNLHSSLASIIILHHFVLLHYAHTSAGLPT